MIQGRSNFVYRQVNPKVLFNYINKKEVKSFHQVKNCIPDKNNKVIYVLRKIKRAINVVPEGYSVTHIKNKNLDFKSNRPLFISKNFLDFIISESKYTISYTPIHVDVNIVHGDVLDIDAFKAWRSEYNNAQFILEDGKYICGWAVEKMSKSMYNVVNPDKIVENYGADTLRLYEMFLGPVEQSKPWDTNGIDGCHRFLKKFWGLFYNNRTDKFMPNDAEATPEQLKSVHKLLKKVTSDIQHFSYNTAISAFMICVNELSQARCTNRHLLANLVVALAPFAPHIAEELWSALGNNGSVCDAKWPVYDEKYLVENEIQLTISFNGKARYQKTFASDATNDVIEKSVREDERTEKYRKGMTIVKVIIVPKKIVNIVVKG